MSADLVIIAGKDILTEAGGHSSYVKAMAMAAIDAGFSPQIFFASLGPDAVMDTRFGRVHQVASPLRHLRRYGPGEGLRTRFLRFHAGPIRRKVEAYLGGRGDPAILHGLGPWGGIGVRVAKRLSSPGRPVIPLVTFWSTMEDEHRGKVAGVSVSRHGVAALLRAQFEYRWMKATVWREDLLAITDSRLVLVNYESVARQVREIEGHAPIRIVPYATPAAFEDPIPERDQPAALDDLGQGEAPLVVGVSRHDSRKGIDILIEALAILLDLSVPFRACIVGPGPLLRTHRQLVEQKGLTSSTAIVGHAGDPIAHLQRADVFVLPSTQEGSGSLSLLEAMQLGRAIVASDVDGIPEDVTHDDSALLVPPGDSHALARALHSVLTDAALRDRLGRRARSVFEARFTAKIFSRSVGDLYAELLRAASTDR